MKSYYVWTHQEAKPHTIEAKNKRDAINAALLLPAPVMPARDVEGYYGDAETHFIPSRVCASLEIPYACTIPKSNWTR